MKKRRHEKALTGIVLSLWKVCNIGHDELDLEKKEVEPKLSTTLVIRLDDEVFASAMMNV